LAKAVVLKGRDGFMLAVLPASSLIQFTQLRKQIGAEVDMANEVQIESIFYDCEPGAVPALGGADGLKVILDDGLASESEIYLGGDHACLVHVSGSNFRKLMADARHARFIESP
jgi:Ala-tRNA(Pro) deacylase